MRKDFCIFILTHGRPDRVHTYDTLMEHSYNGRLFIVIDDEDKAGPEYVKRFGKKVLTFSKAQIAEEFDEGDNFNDRRAIIYARNACFGLARKVGAKYFMQLDDDYTGLYYRAGNDGAYCVCRMDKTFNQMLEALIKFYERSPALSIAISQGGDHIGGAKNVRVLKRKAMNTFICSTERPFQFAGRINEDVNTYTGTARRGGLFFTVMQAQVNQLATQSNQGGMTETYLDSGTYIKSFYSVMYCPSAVKIGTLGDNRSPHLRLHHAINWRAVAPQILAEHHRKPRTC